MKILFHPGSVPSKFLLLILNWVIHVEENLKDVLILHTHTYVWDAKINNIPIWLKQNHEVTWTAEIWYYHSLLLWAVSKNETAELQGQFVNSQYPSPLTILELHPQKLLAKKQGSFL